MEEKNINIEIGENLTATIKELLLFVDKENRRSEKTLFPGEEVQKAFGIDLSKELKRRSHG